MDGSSTLDELHELKPNLAAIAEHDESHALATPMATSSNYVKVQDVENVQDAV